MATILNHLAFVKEVKEFAWHQRDELLINEIESDSRGVNDHIEEKEYYGLKAVAAAEKWFDSLPLSFLEFMPGCTLPPDAKIVMRHRASEPRPHLCAMCWIDGKPFNVQYGGVLVPYTEDEFSCATIAIQA